MTTLSFQANTWHQGVLNAFRIHFSFPRQTYFRLMSQHLHWFLQMNRMLRKCLWNIPKDYGAALSENAPPPGALRWNILGSNSSSGFPHPPPVANRCSSITTHTWSAQRDVKSTLFLGKMVGGAVWLNQSGTIFGSSQIRLGKRGMADIRHPDVEFSRSLRLTWCGPIFTAPDKSHAAWWTLSTFQWPQGEYADCQTASLIGPLMSYWRLCHIGTMAPSPTSTHI